MSMCAVRLRKIKSTYEIYNVVITGVVPVGVSNNWQNATLFVFDARAVESPRSGAAATAATRAASGCGVWREGARHRAAPGGGAVGGRNIEGEAAGQRGRHFNFKMLLPGALCNTLGKLVLDEVNLMRG